MIAANREVDRDWAEFEGYATNLYARSLVMNPSASKLGSEQQTSSDLSTQYQLNTGQLDIKSITDEMTSVRKALSDLHTYFEEVRLYRM
jgi:hypothetical protein